MAITIEANYSKKLGLPNFSSHQYSLTVRKEITDLSNLEKVSSELYCLLQDSVDREIREPGFLGGENETVLPSKDRRISKILPTTGNTDDWGCSTKQRDLILKVVEENKIPWKDAESLAHDRFNVPVKSLNRLQASGFIDELLDKINKSKPAQGRPNSTRSAR